MATIQTIRDGGRNLIIKVTGTGTETNTKIVDVTTLNPPCTKLRLLSASFNLATNAEMDLLWEATANVVIVTLFGSNDTEMDFEDTAGIPNNAGAGITGNVLLNSASTTNYTLYLEFIKSDPQFVK